MKEEMLEIEEEKTKFNLDLEELENEFKALPEHVASEVSNEILKKMRKFDKQRRKLEEREQKLVEEYEDKVKQVLESRQKEKDADQRNTEIDYASEFQKIIESDHLELKGISNYKYYLNNDISTKDRAYILV